MYYGFSVANHSEEPAWFHTPEAAERFAKACWGEACPIEACEEADPKDIMDTPEQSWPAPLLTRAGHRVDQ